MKWFWIAAAAWSHAVCAAPLEPERRGNSAFDDNTRVRVLLDARDQPITLTWKMPSVQLEDRRGTRQRLGVHEIRIERVGQNLKASWGDRTLESPSFTVSTEEPGRHLFQYEGKRYRGDLSLVCGRNGILVINVIALRYYLEGTLASEMNPHWEMEALRAQAVAARSYALHMMRSPKNARYDLENSVRDQVYRGFEGESSRVRFAVETTEAVYLSDDERTPSKAHYHSRCGGMTETAQTVWQHSSPGGKQRVECPYCRKNRYRWKTSWDRHRLARALGFDASLGENFKILASEKSPSGRIASLQFEVQGKLHRLSSDAFRSRLGYSDIQSALFQWKTDRDNIYFEGVGAGHGVGMCQWGARYFARMGKDFRYILNHYYPNLQLTQKARPNPVATR